MAQDFRFGIDIETSVSNNEEAIRALGVLKKEMADIAEGVKINVSEDDIQKAKVQIDALEKTIDELKISGGDFQTVFSRNLQAVQSELKETTKVAKQTTKQMDQLSKAANDSGFANISKTARIATRDIQGASSQIDNLKQNLQQGIGQTLAFGAINAISGAVSDTIKNVSQLDTILTDISIVSGKTADEMKNYRDYAGEAADALGTMGSRYLEASLIYEQQGGLASYYAKDLAEATVIAANISRESTSQMSEYLTATINGFDLLTEKGTDAGIYITDVLSKLGAASGSDLAEVATGLTRTANTARDVGFEFEEISSMIATVSEVTRRTPETIGNAFKSMLTTFTQLREGSEEELNAFTNKVEEAFKLGGIDNISVFDNGNLRDASDIFKDIASQWTTMNTEQQALVAESVAGKYQAETFRAFMNNQERYQDLLGQAYNAAGTAAQQQAVYLDSIQAKTDQLSNQWEILSSSLIDSDMFKGVLEDAGNLLKIINAQESSIMTLAVAVTPLVGVFGQLFGSRFVGEAVQSSQISKLNKQILEDAEMLRQKHGEVGEEIYRQVTGGQELNKVMSSLGKEAGQNFKELVEEADKLDVKIKELSLSDEAFEALIDERTQKLALTGGTDGLQGAEATARVEKEVQTLAKSSNINQLQAEKALQEEIKGIIEVASNTSKAGSENRRAALETIIGLEKENLMIDSESLKIIEQTTAKIKQKEDFIKPLAARNKARKAAEKEILELQKKLNEETHKALVTQKQIVKSKEAEVHAEKEAIKAAAQRKVVADHLNVERSKVSEYQATADLNKDAQQGYLKAVDKTEFAKKATQTLSFGYSTLVPIIASFNAVQKEQISVQDGVISSLQSVGSMLMFLPGPWGKVVGLVSLGLSGLVDKFDLFKSKVESAKEVNEELTRSFLSLQESSSSALGSVKDIEDVYRQFEGANAVSFLNNPESLTEDISAYVEMSEKLASIRPDLVKYYDEEGRAILDLSENYDQLLSKQKEAVAQSFGVLAGGRESFLTEYSAQIEDSRNKLNELTKEASETQKALKTAQENKDSQKISENLSALSEINLKITEAQSTMNKVGELANSNILQPFFSANEILGKINSELGVSSDVLKEFSSNFIDASSLTGLIQGGESESVNAVLDNLDLIYQKYYEIVRVSGEEKGNQFLEGVKNSSGLAKTALFEVQESVDDLLKSLADKEDATAWVENLAIENISNLGKVNPENLAEIDKLQAKVDKMKEPLGDMGVDEIGYALDEVNPSINALNEKIRELKGLEDFDYSNNLEKITDGFEKASQSAQGFESSMAEIGKQEVSIESLKDILENGINDTNLEKLTEYAPEIAKGVKEGTLSADQAMSALVDTQNAAITGMMMNNEAFYEDWKVRNSDQVNFALEAYGIDLQGASTLTEAKLLLENATMAQLRMLASERVENAIKADKIEQDSAKVKFSNLITFSDVWQDSTLTVVEKIRLTFLNIGDEIANFFTGIVRSFETTLNDMNQKLYDKSPDWMKKLWKVSPEEQRERIDKQYSKENSANSADREYSRIQEQRKAEQEEREKLIQSILDGNEFGGNTDLFKGDAEKYIFSGLSGLTIPEIEDSSTDTTKGEGAGNEKEQDVENLRLELNQYYKIENALKRINDQYDLLNKKKDATYGEDKLKLMTQEQELLVKQSKLLKENMAALSQEQADSRRNLSSYGFQFDGQGEIKNLNQRLTAIQNAANKKTGVAKEAAIAEAQALQEEASRYSEVTFNLIPDKKKAIEDAKQTFSKIAKEKVEYAVQIKIDKYDMQREILGVVTEMQDTFETLDEKMGYTGKQAQVALNEVALLQKAMQEVRNNPALTDSDREEMLQKYQTDLLSAVGEARSAYTELDSIQKDFISQTIEKISEVSEGYERIISKSDTMINKLKELYGTDNFGQLEKIYDTQALAIESQLVHLQKNQAALIKYRDTLDKTTEAWKEANEEIISMGESIDEQLIAKIDLLKAKFDDFSNSLFSTFENLFGTWGFEGASADFDDLLNKTDQYMSIYEKMTTIGSKIKSINEEIAKTNDPTKAAALAKYRDEELVALMQQEQVSKDEYERALKLYDIKQKELAIQERERAGRVAQLVRDENGNMSYQYVRQETEDLGKEIDELNDAKNDLYEFDSGKVREASKKIFDIIKDYQSKLKELETKGLSADEYKRELDKLLSGTKAEIDAQQAIVNKWMQNVGKDGFSSIIDLFGQGVVSPEGLGVSEKAMSQIMEGLQNGSLTYQDILAGNYDKFAKTIGMSSAEVEKIMNQIMGVVLGDNKVITDSLLDASNKWTSTADKNVSELGQAYKKYMTEADRVLGQYNKTTGNLNALLDKTNQSSKNVTNSIKKQTDSMVRTKTETDKVSSSVKGLEKMLIGTGNGGLFGSMVQIKNEQNQKLQPSLKTTASLTGGLSSSVNIAAGKYKYMGEKAEEARKRVVAYSDKQTKQGVTDLKTAGSAADKNKSSFDSWKKSIDKTKTSINDLIKTLSPLPGMENFLGKNSSSAKKDVRLGLLNPDTGIKGFDTGGYTGTWTDSTNNATGRMAVLHEKELVLNQYDTSNLLEAVKLQRNLTKSLQNAKLSATSTINKVNETINNNSNTSISQPVVINADFPNVQSQSAIEGAFEGLLGKASTYIGKKV